MKKANIITDCFDILSEWQTLTPPERKGLFQIIIDTLSNYPKPRQKGDTIEPTAGTLGAYLCVSNARNYSKLGILGVMEIETAYIMICQHLETALTLLID